MTSARNSRPIVLMMQGVAVLALVVLAAAAWCSTARMERLAEQQSLERAELKQFHASLVVGIQNLAEQSGMLTSSDLCPVRFRFRFNNGINHPHTQIAVLVRLGTPEEHFLPRYDESTGTAHFGLVPPGNYRLNVRLYDLFELNHDFDVLPGVPVDRVVYCPNADPAGATVAVEVCLPGSLKERGLVFLAHLCRDSLASGGWNWTPVDPEGTTVVAASSEADANRLIQRLLESRAVLSPLSPNAPYSRCRLTGLTVLRFAEAESALPEVLASLKFTDVGELPWATYMHPPQTTKLDQPSLRYEGDRSQAPMQWRWTIDLPAAARELLEDILRVSQTL